MSYGSNKHCTHEQIDSHRCLELYPQLKEQVIAHLLYWTVLTANTQVLPQQPRDIHGHHGVLVSFPP